MNTTSRVPQWLLIWVGIIAATMGSARQAAAESAALKNRTIGYAAAEMEWAVYHSKEIVQECPDGLNVQQSEQVKALWPPEQNRDVVLKYEDTVLKTEVARYWPSIMDDRLPFKEIGATQRVAFGLNLDGKVGPSDFTSPEGKTGIDNQLYRVIGCIENLRTKNNGILAVLGRANLKLRDYSRILFEITDVDDLRNDDAVTVTMYRGLDRLSVDSSDKALPGYTQRVDLKRGEEFVQKMHGKIINGELITEPRDLVFPWNMLPATSTPNVWLMRDARLRLALDEKGADGYMGGYADVHNWWSNLMREWTLGFSPPSVYQALTRYADGYPDARGTNTAISAAIEMKLVQVFLVRPPNVTPGLTIESGAKNSQRDRNDHGKR